MGIRCLISSLAVAGVVAGAGADARAQTCLAAARLDGDPALVVAVGRELAAHGIAIAVAGGDGAATACEPVRVQLERIDAAPGDDAAVIVTIAVGGGPAVERTVRGLRTAATVIESFARTDVGSPLLATRVIEAPPPAVDLRTRAPEPGPAPLVAQPSPSRPGYHLFAGPEVTVASDHSRWLGVQLGACLVLGPVCAGARLRGSTLLHASDSWMDGTERRTTELLIGLDVPLRFGSVMVIPGFSAGFGVFHTEIPSLAIQVESGGLRADAHGSVAIPLWGRFALDVSLAVDLSQQTDPIDGFADAEMVPAEPLALVRFGVGLRYGAR